MAPAFPDITAAAVQLPDKTALDGELVVWEDDRLAFERLQDHLHRRSTAAARAAEKWPAHVVAFEQDLPGRAPHRQVQADLDDHSGFGATVHDLPQGRTVAPRNTSRHCAGAPEQPGRACGHHYPDPDTLPIVR
ncbi:hypothetical protein ACFRDV_39930 [Streptomyces fagopyri]|uniref:hypothetical protein n=1 Tax=Streptomyces fagopyri TaxID=2662397 RepID=UPI0036951353